jgi:uncharacterized spore protein YtfJ
MMDETRVGSRSEPDGGVGPRGSAMQGSPIGDPGETIAKATDRIAEIVGRLSEAAQASAAVGPPQNLGSRTIVPLATVRVSAGWGFGFGGGGGSDEGGGSGGGGGGGGLGSSRIIAIAEVSDDGLKLRPVPDVTTLALGLMALLALAMLGRRRGAGSAIAARAARGRLFGILRHD